MRPVLLGAWLWWPLAAAAEPACEELLASRVEQATHPLLARPGFADLQASVRGLRAVATAPLLWFTAAAPTPQALALADVLARADLKGLDPVDYDSGLWTPRLLAAGNLEACARADLDLAFSVALMRYVSDLRLGRVDPKKLNFHLDVEAKRCDLPEFIVRLAGSSEVPALLARVEPPFAHYRALLSALAQYRRLAADPTLREPLQVPEKSVRPGDRYVDLARLAERLRRFGDLPPEAVGAGASGIYDEALESAVRRFQERHGLARDGILGRATLGALNTPLAERVQQIRLTLERWRWLPDDLGHRPVMINVPEFRLYALEDDGQGGYRAALDMAVIVGQSFPRFQTPLFRGQMSYIVFAPYWYVPPSIQRRELYPKIKQDPAYLAENQLEIVANFGRYAEPLPPTPENIERLRTVQLRLRQPPGAENALGVAKFMFPNDHSVYLHGTPAKRLFGKWRRDFSHGCIRVEDPARLAEHVLSQESGWDRKRVDALIASGRQRQVNLGKRLDVFVLYGTAVAEPQGRVHFFQDIYDHDARLARALRQRGQQLAAR